MERSPCAWDFPLSPCSDSGAGDVAVKAPLETSPWCQQRDRLALSEKHKVSRKGEKNLADTPAASGAENLYYSYPGELVFCVVR